MILFVYFYFAKLVSNKHYFMLG